MLQQKKGFNEPELEKQFNSTQWKSFTSEGIYETPDSSIM